MQQLSGTLRERMKDSALEISEYIQKYQYISPREKQKAVGHMVPEKIKICGGV